MPRLATALKALAFLWSCSATVYLLVASAYEGVNRTSALTGSEAVVGQIDVSLASPAGVWVVGLLVVVTLVAGLPFGVASTYPEGHPAVTWTVALLLFGFSIMSGVTVGLMYLPAAVVLLAAATVPDLVGNNERSANADRRGAV